MATATPDTALDAGEARDGNPFKGNAPSDAELPSEGQALTVARRWHPWRWVVGIAVLVVVAQFVHGLATNPGWDWPVFFRYFTAKSIIAALWLTIQLTFWGTLIGFALGVVLAAARLSPNPVLRVISWTYTWAFRSIPLIVQLLFWFNLGYLYQTLSIGIPFGPSLLDFQVRSVISGSVAAVIGLALHQAAYSAEIVRAGIISVDEGQREAAASLGIPRRREFFKIVLPQAMRGILPNATNEVIALFKGTSIVSVMAIAELFYQVEIIYGRSGRVVPMLMVATVWYVVLTSLLSIVQFYVERHYAKGALRTTPPTPLQKLVRTLSTAAASSRKAFR